MISLYALKLKFQWLLTPTQMTISACLLSIMIGVLFYFNYDSLWIYVVIPVFMFVRMAMSRFQVEERGSSN